LKSFIKGLAEKLRRSFGHQRDFRNRALLMAFVLDASIAAAWFLPERHDTEQPGDDAATEAR
jgi:hypothetical protein